MNESYTWYATLIKPTWAPPSWLFGPVWSVLYVIIAASFGFVFYKVYTGEIPYMVALPFVLNLIFNIAFTPLQFNLRSNELAAIDIALVLATLLWALYAVYPYAKWVALVNIPYLLWVSFATVLQLTITYLNR
jgi:tryptophan-rich sensory protein